MRKLHSNTGNRTSAITRARGVAVARKMYSAKAGGERSHTVQAQSAGLRCSLPAGITAERLARLATPDGIIKANHLTPDPRLPRSPSDRFDGFGADLRANWLAH